MEMKTKEIKVRLVLEGKEEFIHGLQEVAEQCRRLKEEFQSLGHQVEVLAAGNTLPPTGDHSTENEAPQ